MKYALCEILDQTYGFWMDDTGSVTIKHPEAKLWDTREELWVFINAARKRLQEKGYSKEKARAWSPFIEKVPDEAEFRSREDTW